MATDALVILSSKTAATERSIITLILRLMFALSELHQLLGKSDSDLLKIISIGAGAWGSVFAALLQDAYGHFREKVHIRVWRRPGRAVDRSTAEHLFDVINSREDMLRRLIRRCAYLEYVDARLGDRTLYADEILRDGFCLNMVDTPLCPLKVVTNLQEAVWDADIVVNGLPSTETHCVFAGVASATHISAKCNTHQQIKKKTAFLHVHLVPSHGLAIANFSL
ncbi:probable glycerol-3-phosphate dehydrogenase [NAD(+)] 1, cytosolic [Aegilops tauschii subsp. strangulata]|uniref:probable glycerol-3-phosphate dehydrogenase [NAD(+)] 1, cytosolic n=1 Tax=Aegilops tauschii subsp. strangulata TaxID=200361 RepID=UPI001E1CA2CE|nr:probable glycerol-3-phosphate dehydrogenase [NAD(+)] 1, cytosolic [Aegilops tauschii subsp. strangulata]